jgi:thioredoxin reductase (NADPH)
MGNASNDYDVIIVGAGPAGLTAGIYTVRSGLKTLILEEKFPGGMMAEAPFIENYPGLHEVISGLELANRMEMQAKKFGAQINSPEKVIKLELEKIKNVKTKENTYRAKAVILSPGCIYRLLGVLGERKFYGKGVSYCAICDGHFFKGKRTLVVGGGNSAVMTAIHLSTLASEVKLVHRRDSLRTEDILMGKLGKNVDVILNTVVKEIRGDTMVKAVILEDVRTGQKKTLEVDGVFIRVGEDPRSQIAKDSGVKIDEEGYVIVNERQRTNIEGVYAAGDVTNCPTKQVGTAVGQAIIAAAEAFAYVKKNYYYQEK